MAIAPTGAIYKALEFGGISSRNYGVYITGEAVYNAPERDVQMITIPGRSGSFALDNGRFQNIEVSYPAGIFTETEADFRDAISEFRNFLCSRKGYVRLRDEYNPNEYRMAVYKSGLDVNSKQLRAGEFTITFDCKPQRWLTSGETAVTIANSGDAITNPTTFDASPLLEVKGIGNITINGKNISIENVPLGSVSVYSGASSSSSTSNSIHLWFQMDLSRLNTGDAITLSGVQAKNAYSIVSIWDSTTTITQLNLSNITNMASSTKGITGARTGYVNYSPIPFTFYKGTAATSVSSSIDVYGQIMGSSQTTHDETRTYTYYAQYDGNDRIDLYFSKTNGSPAKRFDITTQAIIPEIMGNSTISTLPTPVYIDLDIGEAYGEYSGVISSVNNAVILPANLPTLAPGSNTITFDNTITDLKVVPRWWKV